MMLTDGRARNLGFGAQTHHDQCDQYVRHAQQMLSIAACTQHMNGIRTSQEFHSAGAQG